MTAKKKGCERVGATSKPTKNSNKMPELSQAIAKKMAKMPHPPQTQTIAICNQKGGCGKTTSVINLGASLALLGKKVLIIDLDAQCNTTTGVGIVLDDIEKSIFDFMVDPKNTAFDDVVLETAFENLHIAPGSRELSGFDLEVASELGRENRLKKFIASLPENFYHVILIDTPPSLGLLLVNALNAANQVHIALQAHPFAFDGLQQLIESIESVQEELNPKLQISGIIMTMFDTRTRMGKEIIQQLQQDEKLSPLVYQNVIRQNIKIAESNKERCPVYYYDKTSSGAEDYLNLAKEYLKRLSLSCGNEVQA